MLLANEVLLKTNQNNGPAGIGYCLSRSLPLLHTVMMSNYMFNTKRVRMLHRLCLTYSLKNCMHGRPHFNLIDPLINHYKLHAFFKIIIHACNHTYMIYR